MPGKYDYFCEPTMNRIMKSSIRLIILAVSILVFFGCKKDDVSDISQLNGRFSIESVIIEKDATYQLPFQISRKLGPYEDYDFVTDPYKLVPVFSNTAVLSYVGKGIVRATASGSTDVKIWLNGKFIKMSVTVAGTPVDPGKPMDPDSLALANAPWNWKTASTGVVTGYANFRLFDKMASISIAHYPESKLALFIAYHTGSQCMTTSQAGKDAGAAVAINGSFFNTSTLVANTFYASKGTAICNKALDTRSNGIVGIYSGGHNVDITAAQTAKFTTYTSTYAEVIASGPVLLQSGEMYSNPHNDFNDTSHPRSIIGKDKNGEIWMIVIDGRFPGQGEGASIEECSKICKFLGLYDAINLDGGGSSSLWTPSTGVINHPCDNKKWTHDGERKDPTIFVAK